MGSEISAFIIEPLVGAGAVALAIFAIINQKKHKDKNAKWYTIGSIAVIALLIVINIILTIMAE